MPIEIPKLKFSEPRRNLPGRRGIATEEDRFTIAFARAYAHRNGRIHPGCTRTELALAREIPVNGYGIADLVAVAWEPCDAPFASVDALLESRTATTRAFECKLRNWRSALSQAARYRFFAHQSIIVLSRQGCAAALPCLETFRKTGIGLWDFDPALGCIRVHHTPRTAAPKSWKYLVHAVGSVHRATRRSLPIR